MRYMLTGRVHPERAGVSFNQITLKTPDGGSVIANCDASQISLQLDLPNVDGWITAYVVGEELATLVVAAIGFEFGCGYSVEIVQVNEEDGSPHVFGVRPTGNTPEETLEVLGAFQRVLDLCGRNVFFRLAVQDYVRAIADVGDCATYCYRAIEGIKSSFVFKTGHDRWDEMHAALGTTRDSIEEAVKSYADPIRHGNWVNVKITTSVQRWEMLNVTRAILLKYLDHEQSAI